MDPSEFDLKIRFAKIEPAPGAPPTGDCTDDDCGNTPGSAGIANC
jgi:hypothetical protein